MNQGRYQLRVFSPKPQLDLASGIIDEERYRDRRKETLDKVSKLIVKNYEASSKRTKDGKVWDSDDLRERLETRLNDGGIVVWAENREVEHGKDPEAVGYAEIVSKENNLSSVFADAEGDTDHVLDELMRGAEQAGRVAELTELNAWATDIPRPLLERHGFQIEDAFDGDFLFAKDLGRRSRGEKEQDNTPPEGIPPAGNI